MWFMPRRPPRSSSERSRCSFELSLAPMTKTTKSPSMSAVQRPWRMSATGASWCYLPVRALNLGRGRPELARSFAARRGRLDGLAGAADDDQCDVVVGPSDVERVEVVEQRLDDGLGLG